MKKLRETDIQAALFDWIRAKQKVDDRYLWAYSIPNGFWVPGSNTGRKYAAIAKLTREGLVPGVSDVSIPWPTKRHHGLYLELKAPGKKVKKGSNQDRFLLAMRDRGYCAGEVDDLDYAIRIIKNYMR